jgi:hypothetical protein
MPSFAKILIEKSDNAPVRMLAAAAHYGSGRLSQHRTKQVGIGRLLKWHYRNPNRLIQA